MGDASFGMDPLVAANASRAFASFLGCGMGDLQCLRKATLENVEKAQEAALDAVCGEATHDFGNQLCRQSTFLPVIDGTLLPASPFQLLQQGRFNRDVDVVIGSNTNEGGDLAPSFAQSKSVSSTGLIWEYRVRDLLNVSLRRPQHSPVPSRVVQKVLMRYPHDNLGFVSDLMYICPSEQVVQLLSTFSNKNVYRYRFMGMDNDAVHAGEEDDVFDKEADDPYPFTPAEQAFSEDIGAAWANFAGSGVPAASWQTYQNSTDVNIVLAPGDWQTEMGWRTEFCDFWAHLCDDQFCDSSPSMSILI